jgi:hypothetical protein
MGPDKAESTGPASSGTHSASPFVGTPELQVDSMFALGWHLAELRQAMLERDSIGAASQGEPPGWLRPRLVRGGPAPAVSGEGWRLRR